MSPLNCPIPFSANRPCSECGDNWGGNCNYNHYSPIPINNILTPNERMQALEDKVNHDKKENSIEFSGVGRGTLSTSTNIRDGQTRGMMLFLQRKLNEHLASHKKRGKKSQSIWINDGQEVDRL